MGTILAVLIETGSRPGFWTDMAARGVRAATSDIPPLALIDCRDGDFTTPQRLAEQWSRELSTKAIALVAQTTTSFMLVQTFENGRSIRSIQHDDESDFVVEGIAQPWEAALFFDDTNEADGSWPHVLFDELADDDVARYWAAKATGDATPVLHLLHPDHLSPLYRLCAFYGLDAATPSASWKKPSLWSRMFGR
jgi:hypothetical protein